MNKKLYGLISTLVTCTGTAVSALIAYFQPENFAPICGAVAIAVPAINDILLLFVDESKSKK